MKNCNYHTISGSQYGKIIYCKSCTEKVAFQFNNITQGFTKNSFFEFSELMANLNADDFFLRCPNEDRIHIKTEVSDLYFSFTPDEFTSLKKMLAASVLILKSIDYSQTFRN